MLALQALGYEFDFPNTSLKKPGVAVCLYSQNPGGGDRKIPGALWLASLVNGGKFKATRNLPQKGTDNKIGD